jgi:hypothetical protein
MDARPSTWLVEISDASHFMTMERPDIVKREIERMVEAARS